MLHSRVLLFIIIFILSACARTDIRQTNDFQNIFTKQNQVSVLPPQAYVITSDIVGTEDRQYDYEYYVQDEIAQKFTTALEIQGYKAKTINSRTVKDKKAFRELETLTEKTQSELNRLFNFQDNSQSLVENAHNIETDMGPSAKIVAQKLDTNLVGMVFYEEIIKTSGAQMRDFIVQALVSSVGGQQSDTSTEHAFITFALVDLQRSKIIWAYRAVDTTSQLGSLYNLSMDDKEIIDAKIDNLIQQVIVKLDTSLEIE